MGFTWVHWGTRQYWAQKQCDHADPESEQSE